MKGLQKRKDIEKKGIGKLDKDTWDVVLSYLGIYDLQNLRLTNRYIEKQMRKKYFSKYYMNASKIPLNLPRFQGIMGLIRRVYVNNITRWNALLKMKTKFHLTHIWIGHNFVGSIEIPEGVIYFEMGYDFNQPIVLPSSLTHLVMRTYFNQPIVLPSSLTHLVMRTYFNQPIRLPSNLIHLKMGHRFNQPIDLPSGLVHLEMGHRFNQPIDIPSSVKTFRRGQSFDQPVLISPDCRVYNWYDDP